MSRFKHRLKEPFGKAGLTVAVLALVLAMVGGAYAAGGLTKSQEKQVTKIAKKYAGKPGAPGANGAAGAVGAKGATGAAGANGTNGTNGAPGTSVTNTTLAKGSSECPEGGSKFVGTSTTKACNGSPWTAGGILPKGKTLTGEWSISGEVSGAEKALNTAVSFALPLSTGPTKHYIRAGTPEANDPTGCTGTVSAPGAAEGNLCVFAVEEENTETESGGISLPVVFGLGNLLGTNVDPFGFGIKTFSHAAGEVQVSGSWAVTAAE